MAALRQRNPPIGAPRFELQCVSDCNVPVMFGGYATKLRPKWVRCEPGTAPRLKQTPGAPERRSEGIPPRAQTCNGGAGTRQLG